MTPDGLPILGRVDGWRNVYLATGHGMSGVMLAPASGHILARLILDDGTPEELGPFTPGRFARVNPRRMRIPTRFHADKKEVA